MELLGGGGGDTVSAVPVERDIAGGQFPLAGPRFVDFLDYRGTLGRVSLLNDRNDV